MPVILCIRQGCTARVCESPSSENAEESANINTSEWRDRETLREYKKSSSKFKTASLMW